MRQVREYDVWEASIELALTVYRVSRGFPADERFGLTAQVRRASISVGSNLAEGAGRATPQDFARFIGMSIGSANELEFQLSVAERLGYVDGTSLGESLSLVHRVRAMLTRLHQSLTT